MLRFVGTDERKDSPSRQGNGRENHSLQQFYHLVASPRMENSGQIQVIVEPHHK